MGSTKIGVDDFPDLKENGVKIPGSTKDPCLSSGLGRFLLAECLTWRKLGMCALEKKPTDLGENGKVISDFF